MLFACLIIAMYIVAGLINFWLIHDQFQKTLFFESHYIVLLACAVLYAQSTAFTLLAFFLIFVDFLLKVVYSEQVVMFAAVYLGIVTLSPMITYLIFSKRPLVEQALFIFYDPVDASAKFKNALVAFNTFQSKNPKFALTFLGVTGIVGLTYLGIRAHDHLLVEVPASSLIRQIDLLESDKIHILEQAQYFPSKYQAPNPPADLALDNIYSMQRRLRGELCLLKDKSILMQD